MSPHLSASSSEGLILDLLRSPTDATEELGDWCDAEVIPAHLEINGFQRGVRYSDLELGNETLIAYELSDAAPIGVQPSFDLRRGGSQRGRRLFEKLFRQERRTYKLIKSYDDRNGANVGPDAPILLAVWWEPQSGTEHELQYWYEEEHIPLLLNVPGWSRIRRYELISGTGPKFLALHELQDIAALTRPEHRTALSTPMRSLVISHRDQYERRVFQIAHCSAVRNIYQQPLE